jgi:hypothetical protein
LLGFIFLYRQLERSDLGRRMLGLGDPLDRWVLVRDVITRCQDVPVICPTNLYAVTLENRICPNLYLPIG